MKIKAAIRSVVLDKKNAFRAIAVALVFLYSFVLIVLCESLSRGSLGEMISFIGNSPTDAIFVNCSVLTALAMLFLWLITTKLSVSVGLVSVLLYIVHLVNYLKTSMRSEPFFPWDIKLAGEAANIIGDMNVSINTVMVRPAVIIIIAVIISILADIFFKKYVAVKYRFALPMSLAVLAGLMLLSRVCFSAPYRAARGISMSLYQQLENYDNYGFIYSFVFNYQNASVEVPEATDSDGILETLSEAGITSQEKLCTQQDIQVENPNIIILMSEAFIDIQESENLIFDEELLPNYRQLSDNYLSGKLITQQFCGGTANSEFEVITGLSNYFMPSGTIAYTNYIGRETDSLASFLEENGYKTLAIHPYLKDFFSRDKAYGFLGFSEFLSDESFEGYETKRWANFYSDAALSQKIIEQYEQNKDSGKPFFNLSVSMQNHGGYDKDDFHEETVNCEINAEVTESAQNAIPTYVTGIALADRALGQLVDYFSNCGEPTIIIFFGDHVPYISDGPEATFEAIGYTGSLGTLESNYKLHSTPYVVWNNFEETPTHQTEDMSMFFLMPYVTRTLGLDRPNYYYFLDYIYQSFHGITPFVCLTSDGEPVNQPTEDMEKALSDMQTIQYDLLFGDKVSEDYLF